MDKRKLFVVKEALSLISFDLTETNGMRVDSCFLHITGDERDPSLLINILAMNKGNIKI